MQSAWALQQAGFLQLLQRLLKVDRAKLGSPTYFVFSVFSIAYINGHAEWLIDGQLDFE